MSAPVRLPRFAALLIGALLASLALVPAANSAPRAHASSLGGAACNLLSHSQVSLVVFQSPPYTVQPFGPNGCQEGQCWQHITDPNNPEQTICHYARGAFIVLARHPTQKSAMKVVRGYLRKGLRRINLGADLAGYASGANTGLVVLSVGRTVATFTLGASSDDDPNPTFDNLYDPLTTGAAGVAQALHHRGCPQHAPACE